MENSYQVFVDDNFHHGDENERYKLGDFATFDEAADVCKEIVDNYLRKNFEKGMSAEQLYESYTAFGEDPFIVGEPTDFHFLAWNYAKKRCLQICGEES